MEDLGKLKDDEGRDLGRIVSVNGKTCFLPRDAEAIRYLATRNDNDEVNPLGLRDDVSERILDYGSLRRELSDDDRDND